MPRPLVIANVFPKILMIPRLMLFLVGMIIPTSSNAESELTPIVVKPIGCLGTSKFRHTASIKYTDITKDGKTLFTLSEDGVFAWDLETGISRFIFDDQRVRNSLSLSPDGKQLLSISQDDAAIWDVKTGKEIKRFDGSYAGNAAFAPDGKGVILFREGMIEYWGIEKGSNQVGKCAKFLEPAFSPDKKWFAAAVPNERPRGIAICADFGAESHFSCGPSRLH
jgi:WD40 repeat protein